MKLFIVFGLLFGSVYVSAQEACPLQMYGSMAKFHLESIQAEAYPHMDPFVFNERLQYEKAPLENIGSVHDAQNNVVCSAMFRGPYAITHSECIRKIKTLDQDHYFTMYLDGEKYTSRITKSTISDYLGGFLVEDDLPYKESTVQVGFDFSDFTDQKGWVIKGGNGKTTTSFSIADDCKITQISGNKNRYTCSQSLAYEKGAIMMGNLCGQWLVVGIKSVNGDYVLPIDKQSLVNVATNLGSSCAFVQSESCLAVEQKKAHVYKELPTFKNNGYEPSKELRYENYRLDAPRIGTTKREIMFE